MAIPQANAVAAPAATRSISCDAAGATPTVWYRAPVHTQPKGTSPVAWVAASGKTYRIGGYCDDSAGNRWYCVASCDFDDGVSGYWIWEEYFRG